VVDGTGVGVVKIWKQGIKINNGARDKYLSIGEDVANQLRTCGDREMEADG